MHSAFSFSPEIIEILGWTLVHFVWQGAALALALYAALAFCRSARARYALALGTLVLMTICPVATFASLKGHAGPGSEPLALRNVGASVRAVASASVSSPLRMAVSLGASFDWPRCCVGIWLIGVLALSLRALGGWILIARLRRECAQPLSEALARRCTILQQRLGVSRGVRYLQSRLVDSPAVIGWFRPIVLLPVSALVGLSPQQLEAIIVHELAHIRRLDCFVNAFQIAAETLLFYHPALWWVSRCIRTERENCCDDAAVAACGDATGYARALAALETWRGTPAMVLAANTGSLKMRISRLIGLQAIARNGIPRAGIAAAIVLCAAGVVLASSAFHVAFSDFGEAGVRAQDLSSSGPNAQPATPAAAQSSRPHLVAPATSGWPLARQARSVEAAENHIPLTPQSDAQNASQARPDAHTADPPSSGSYIGDLEAVGFRNLTVDQLIALKVQGVRPEYIRRLREAGLNPNTQQLIALRVHGITPEYVRDMQALGLSPALEQLIAMKVQDVTPEYVRTIRSGFPDAGIDQVIALKVQGVTPEFIQKVRSHGFTNLTLHQLLALKAAGVF